MKRTRATAATLALLVLGASGLHADEAEDRRAEAVKGMGGSLPGLPAQAADLKNINRAIVKEPKYSSQPYYALLVFGPEARTRVWLVLDDHVLYLDRNGNGDLTEANERIELDVAATTKTPGEVVFDIGEIAGVRLRLQTRDTLQGAHDDRDDLTNEQRELLRKFRQDHKKHGWKSAALIRICEDGSRMHNSVVFCQQPKDAQISHFSGPLTFSVRSVLAGTDDGPLKRGADELFTVCIGTPGLATRHFGYYPIFARLTTSEVPAGVHPLAEFEFPHQDPDQSPIKVKVTLDQRC